MLERAVSTFPSRDLCVSGVGVLLGAAVGRAREQKREGTAIGGAGHALCGGVSGAVSARARQRLGEREAAQASCARSGCCYGLGRVVDLRCGSRT